MYDPRTWFLLASGCLAAFASVWVLKTPIPSAANLANPESNRAQAIAVKEENISLARDEANEIVSPNTIQGALHQRVAEEIHGRPEPPGAQTERFLTAAMEASRNHPFEAVRALSRLHPSAQRDLALAHAVSQWANVAPVDALDWVRGLPEGELREDLAASATTAVAQNDPVMAANFVNSEMDAGIAQNRAAVAVVQRWAQVDPAAASEWADSIREPSVRDDAYREIAVLGKFPLGVQ